jgi:hypothetical protein
MISDRDIELAHPEAFDVAFGNLAAAKRAGFDRHLTGCRYCQSVVAEYSEIGRILKDLPPHVAPPAGLEQRTVTAILAAMAGQRPQPEPRPGSQDQAATRIYPTPGQRPLADAETRPWSRPPPQQPASPAPQVNPPDEPRAAPAAVRALPVWRRYPRRFAAAALAAAAAVIAAVVVPLSLTAGQVAPAVHLEVFHFRLKPTNAAKNMDLKAARGWATARQDATGSWHLTLTVQHLKHYDPKPWYECWYISSKPGQPQVAPAGSFLVSGGGRQTFTMTSAVDPRDFKTMEITLQPPSPDGAIQKSNVILRGQPK